MEYKNKHFNFKGNKWVSTNTPENSIIGVDAKGYCFLIDITDYPVVKNYCWTLVKGRESKKGGYFAARKSRKDGHQIMMLHNFIWEQHYGEIPSDCLIDHIDQNPMNNKLSNLRLANKSINAVNCDLRSSNNSGVIGVSFDIRSNTWRNYLTFNKKRIEFSRSQTKEEAIIKRLKGELEYFGEYAPQKHLFKEYNIW